jgi:F0F1-type ATP synthase delta subunit
MSTDLELKAKQLTDAITLVHLKDTVTIMTAYKLSHEEIGRITELFPALQDRKIINMVDATILSGLIIKVGTRIFDLTLNSALENLRKQIYESN